MNQTTTELSPGYLINNFPDVVTIIDKSGKIIFVNPSAHTIFKIDSQLLTNKNAIDFIHFGDRNNILKLVNENIKKGKRNFNIQFRARFNKNQKWKWIESNGNIVFEKEIHFILNSLEIIKVKKSLSELDLHKNALMHTVDGVLINEFGGKKNKIIYANKELCRLFNVDLNSVFGNNIMSFLSLFNIDNELGQELLVQINKNNNYKREFYFHDHSGKSLCFLLKAYPLIKSLKSSTTYFVTTFTDITEKTKEQKLLNEKLIELDSFVYKACHDIKGPLASIQGLSNLGIEQIKDTQAIKLFKTIKESTDRLDNVLTELLLLSNLEHGVRKFEELDIAQIIDTIIESYQFSKAYENIKMKFNYAANAKIVSDPLSVKSIIQNIIDNAIKYKNQQLAEAEILIETVDYKQGVLLSIYDNGVGIEEFQIKKIFEMFYRGNTSSKGTGLGLYIVKKSLEKIGGTISVQSQINKGSKFLIYLPSKYNRNE